MLLHVSSEIRRCCHQRHFILLLTGVGWREVTQWMRSSPGEKLDLLLPSPASASPFPTEYFPFSGAPGGPVSMRRGKSMETKAEKLGAACQVRCGLVLTAAYWLECDYLAPICSHSIFSTPVPCDIIFIVLLSRWGPN